MIVMMGRPTKFRDHHPYQRLFPSGPDMGVKGKALSIEGAGSLVIRNHPIYDRRHLRCASESADCVQRWMDVFYRRHAQRDDQHDAQ
jgi:hypothetical protein